MKILILSNVPPGRIGGAEVQALHLARRWSAAGHTVTVAGYANLAHTAKNLSIAKIPVLTHYRITRGISFLATTLVFLWRQRNQYDLIYCRFLKEHTFIACIAKLIFNLKKPIVACPACASTGGEAEYILKSPLKSVWLRLLSRNIEMVNGMSKQIRQESKMLGFKDSNISSIPNGVVIPALPIQVNSSGPINIVFVGRLVEQKGLNVLLNAVKCLSENKREFKVTIIGDGPLHQTLAEFCRKNKIEQHVKFQGEVAPDQVLKHLSLANLFVLPSFYEGFSGALLEAIASGLPAIATKVSGSDEIIDENIGWLVPPGNVLALTNAMDNAISLGSDKLAEMGKQARIKAINKFDIDRIAEQYLKLFEQLITD